MRVYVFNLGRTIKVVSFVMTLVVAIGFALGFIYLLDDSVVSAHSENLIDGSRVIILDAGHGGEDSGAVGDNGALEKDLNLSIALQIKDELTKAGYTVIMTREDDKMLYREEENIKGLRKLSDLKNRLKIAEAYPGAMLVSIHMNSFGKKEYSGLQVYYKPDSESSELLANNIQSAVRSNLQKENERKIKAGEGIYLLENSTRTSVLIECGFLTNPEECKKLSEKEYQKELSFAIVCGIIKYIEGK